MRFQRNYVGDFESSFLSCEKDAELITKKLLVDSRPYSDELKRLLLINAKDCLDNRTNQEYKDKIRETSVADMIDKGYIRLNPQIQRKENEEAMNFIIISFRNFSPTSNLHYRNCVVMIDVLSYFEYWDLGNFRVRPLKIAGYIDGILNEAKLTGIGTLNFVTAEEINIANVLGGYCLMYEAVHGDDDLIPPEE